jgi:hypothetical protein
VTSKTDQRIRGTAPVTPQPMLDGYELAGCADRAGVIVCKGPSGLPLVPANWDRFANEINKARAAAPAVEDAPRSQNGPCMTEEERAAHLKGLGEALEATREDAPRVESHWYLKAGEDATPRTTVLQRAATWKESDLRKFPTATLELIDSLVAELRAATPQPRSEEEK